MKFWIFSLIVLLIIFSFFLFRNSALSQWEVFEPGFEGGGGTTDGEEEEECISEITCSSYCVGGCGGELWETCCDSCNGCWDNLIEDCNPWQMCSTGGCYCKGECLEAPESPRYYNNPTYSNRPDKDLGNDNIKLPVKLDWDDVEGWGQPEGPQSYVIDIENAKDTFPKTLSKSEFIPGSCTLKSNATYPWQVKACCSADGQNCGPESNWSFTTSLAPEPVSPADPDWNGKGKTEELSYEESRKLQWCKIEDPDYYEETIWVSEKYYRPLSYKLLIYYGTKDLCHPLLALLGRCSPIVLSPDTAKGERLPPDEFWDEHSAYFTKKTSYAWKVAACKDAYGEECSNYSQLWRFATADWRLSVKLDLPANDKETPIGLPVVLKWISPSANSFNYKVKGVASGQTKIDNISFDYPQLSPDTVYSWEVQPCWDYEAQDCEDTWYGPWYFKTTGKAPQLNYPVGDNIPIPIKFKWDPVGGAKSYVIKIWGGELDIEKPVEKPEFSLDYPDLKQEANYSWQVKTCAREGGEACGDYSTPQTFATFRLSAPTEPSPVNGGQLSAGTKIFSWANVKGAKAYQYQIKYLSLAEKEVDETCPPLVGKNLFEKPKTILGNSDFVELKCLGQYQWQVAACLDKDCQEVGEWSNWTFSLVEPGEIKKGGLVPCGQAYDNPDTPWNERESCQIKHFFLLIKIILDFIFTRVIPFGLVLLTLATGAMFYLSLGGKVIPIMRIKRMWKYAIIGLLLVFFAWTLVNLILKLVGFNIGIFGHWYQI